MLIIGSHVSLKSPNFFLDSVKESLENGANALMIYTGAPQNTIRQDINIFKIDKAHELLKENNISFSNIIVHAPYIVNLANPNKEKRDFAIDFLKKEVIRSEKLKARTIVLHPGSAVGGDRNKAIEYIAQGINKVLDDTKDLAITISLETMAGKGNEVGKTFDELADIISRIKQKQRVEICLDTCHINDAGYDLVNNYENIMKDLDEKIGLGKVSVIHLNDSKNILGAAKDRHENIGKGYIGFETLLKVSYDKRFENIPKILETPYYNNLSPYKKEIEMLKAKKYDEDFLNKL